MIDDLQIHLSGLNNTMIQTTHGFQITPRQSFYPFGRPSANIGFKLGNNTLSRYREFDWPVLTNRSPGKAG